MMFGEERVVRLLPATFVQELVLVEDGLPVEFEVFLVVAFDEIPFHGFLA